MPIFEYRALSTTGKGRKGIVDADTARDAREKLRLDQVHVTEMWEVNDAKEVKAAERSRALIPQLSLKRFRLQRRIKTRELATFTRQFSTLLKSGIQLAEALRALVDQATDRNLEQVLRVVKEEITSGNNLAEALAKHPNFFSDLYVNMVR